MNNIDLNINNYNFEDILNLFKGNAGEEVLISGEKYLWEDYSFSWQIGVEGDYGHQGYHGLKGEMYDNFIRLGSLKEDKMSLKRVPEAAGNYYILLTSVIAPEEGDFELLFGDVRPVLLYMNSSNTDVNSKTIHLKKGKNPLLMIYDKACETYLLCRESDKPVPQRQPVSMRWYKDYGVLPFSYTKNGIKSGLFAFESAPGFQSITFSAYGKVTVWIDGVETEARSGKRDPDGLTEYHVQSINQKPGVSQGVIKIEYKPGYGGGAAIPQYIRQNCDRKLWN